MGITRTFTLICCCFILSACVYAPVVDRYEDASASCRTYTKSMSLKEHPMSGNCTDNSCLGGAIVVTAGSLLISGSIVLAGNIVHWLEYQGTCSDGYLNATRQLFIRSIDRTDTASEG